MMDSNPTSWAEPSRREEQMLAAVRAEVAAIVAHARTLQPHEVQQFIGLRIERFTVPMVDVSEAFALAVARHLSWQVRRLLTH